MRGRSIAVARRSGCSRLTWQRALDEDLQAVPEAYWSARPAPADDTGAEQLSIRGAVVVRARAVAPVAKETQPLSLELTAALAEPPARPGRELLSLLLADGLLAPAAVVGALVLAAIGGLVEALLFRGLFDVANSLVLWQQRAVAIGGLLAFSSSLLLLELPTLDALFRIGRHLEARLRIAFLTKIPRLGDRYFSSRPASDMAERAHAVQQMRTLPQTAQSLLQRGLRDRRHRRRARLARPAVGADCAHRGAGRRGAPAVGADAAGRA